MRHWQCTFTSKLCGHQLHHSNVLADSPSSHYKRIIVFHAKPSFNRNERSVQQPSSNCISGLFLVPSVLITLTEDDSRSKIGKLVGMYKRDLPSLDSLLSKSHCWYL